MDKEEKNENKNESCELIYNLNPIQEYKEEIMNNLFKMEMENRPNYSIFPQIYDKNNNILTYLKRFSYINVMISYQLELLLHQETLFLSINLFDRYIQKLILEKKNTEDLNIIALTCLFIASKYEEIYPPYLQDYLDLYKNKYLKRDIFLKEDEILSKLDFQVLNTSPFLFLKIFCQFDNNYENKQNQKDNDTNICFYGAQFFLELCLIEPKFCELKPSLQAAICLYLSRKFLLYKKNNNNKIWSFDLFFKTNYSEIKIKKHIKIALITINNFFKNIYTKNFMAMPLYIKYYTHEYSMVSSQLKEIILGN